MEQKLKEIFAEVFEINRKEITLNSSINNVEKWSSLMHFKLIATIEKAFNVTFKEDEFMQLTSFDKIFNILQEK